MTSDCAFCGKPGAYKLWDIRHLPPFQVFLCSHCDVAFTHPIPPSEQLSRYYPASYYGKVGYKFNPLIELLVYLSRARRAQRIMRYIPRGRILDVGCGGRTQFLSWMHRRGWEAYGNEIVEFPTMKELEKQGIGFQICDFLKSSYSPDYFNVVVFWHVLEHLSKPMESLRKSHALLKPGGLLLLALPDRASLQAQWAGRHWFHLDIPRHCFHFTLKAMLRILEEEGFEVLNVSHFSFEQDIFSWIQSIYNRFGFRHNLLYNMLRTRHAKMHRREPGDWLQAAAIAALFPAVFLLSISLFLIEIALRRGGCMEIYARKKA